LLVKTLNWTIVVKTGLAKCLVGYLPMLLKDVGYMLKRSKSSYTTFLSEKINVLCKTTK